MKDRIIGRIAWALMLALLSGCSADDNSSKLVDRAERIAIDMPDSALNIMRSINPKDIDDEHALARYRLVYSETLYYNYMEGDNDSLTRPMVKYYMTNEHNGERARAMFQHAQIKKNGGHNVDAMYYLMEAEKSLKSINNPRLEGLVHRSKGEIYGAEYLFNNALSEYLLAKKCFEAAGSEYYLSFSNYDIGRVYLSLQDFEMAEEHLKMALETNNDGTNIELITDILYNLLDTYTSIPEYDKLVEIIEQYDDYLKRAPEIYYLYKAIYYATLNDSNSAIANIALAEENNCNTSSLDYTKYIVYSILGKSDYALQYIEKSVKRQNAQILQSLEASVLNMQVEQSIREKLEIEMRGKYEKRMYIFIMVIVSIVLLCFTYIKIVRKKAEIEILKSQVEGILSDLDKQSTKVKSLNATANDKERMMSTMRRNVTELISRELKHINDLLDAYYSDVTRKVKHNQVIAALDNYVKDFSKSENGYKAVESLVNQYNDGIMENLRTEVPNLKEEEYRLLCLIFADFSSNAICMFMSYDKNKLYKHKSKLKSILHECRAEHKSQFINNLR